MEPSPEEPSAGLPPPRDRWFPRPAETGLAAVGAVLALLLAVVADPAGRILFATAALGLLALTAADLVLRPRLAADAAGVRIRTLALRADLPWSAVERVAVDERTRRGLTARTLELDADGALVLLGRRSLGADPREVADALARIRYTTPSSD